MLQYIPNSNSQEGYYLLKVSETLYSKAHNVYESIWISSDGCTFLQQIDADNQVTWNPRVKNGLTGQPLQLTLTALPPSFLRFEFIHTGHSVIAMPRLKAAAGDMRHDRELEKQIIGDIISKLERLHNEPNSAERNTEIRSLINQCKHLEGVKSWSNHHKGILGEARTALSFLARGYQQLPSKIGSNQGFDGVWERTKINKKEYVISESKYNKDGEAKMSKGTRDDNGGYHKQGSPGWIQKNIQKMQRSKDPEIKKVGETLKAHKDNLRFFVGVTSREGVHTFGKWKGDKRLPFTTQESKEATDIAMKTREANLKQVVQQTHLEKTYNSTNPQKPIPEHTGINAGIGGVGLNVGIIPGMAEDPTMQSSQNHYFLFSEPTHYTEQEFRQVIRELAIGIYRHNEKPMFSLHFNENSTLYPVLSPVYENTLTGHVMGMLDYIMKGFLNGGFFDEHYINQWQNRPNADTSQDIDQIVNLQTYIKEHLGDEVPYRPFRYLMALHDIASSNEEYAKHTSSFRIIADSAMQRHQNVFQIGQAFHVEYTIEGAPGFDQFLKTCQETQGQLPEDYQKLDRIHEIMAEQIQQIMPKLPCCQKYFQLLGVIHFFSCYFTTLKSMGQVNLLGPSMSKTRSFPAQLPSLPISQLSIEQIHLEVAELFKQINKATLDELNDHLKQCLSKKYDQDRFTLDDLGHRAKKECETILKRWMERKARFNPLIDQELFDLYQFDEITKNIFNQIFDSVVKQLKDIQSIDLHQQSKQLKSLLNEMDNVTKPRIDKQNREQQDEIDRIYRKGLRDVDSVYRDNMRQIDQALRQAQSDARMQTTGNIVCQVNMDAFHRARRDVENNFESNKNMVEKNRRENISNLKSGYSKAMQEFRKNRQQIKKAYDERLAFENDLENQIKLGFKGTQVMKQMEMTVPFPGLEIKLLSKTFSDEDQYQQYKIVGGCGMALHNISAQPIEAGDAWQQASQHDITYADDVETFKTLTVNQESKQAIGLRVTNFIGQDHEYDWLQSRLSSSIPIVDQLDRLHQHILNNDITQLSQFLSDYAKRYGQVKTRVLINAQDRYGQTAAHLAAVRDNLNIVFLLRDHGADLNIADDQQHIPFHITIIFDAKMCFEKTIERMSDNPSASYSWVFSKITKYNANAIHLAAQHGRHQILRSLLEQIALHHDFSQWINHRTHSDLTPLYTAIHQGHQECALVLLDYNQTDVNLGDMVNHTPLHLAVLLANEPIVSALVHRGANINAKRKDMATPLHLAVTAGDLKVCQLLAQGDQQLQVNAALASGLTPLHLAAKEGYIFIVQWLVEEAKVNVNQLDQQNKNAMMLAFENNHIEVAQYLQQYSDLLQRDDQERSGLLMAAESADFVWIESYIRQSAQIDIRCPETGFNFLHFCALYGKKETLILADDRKLITKSMFHIQDCMGRTPAEIALSQGHYDCFLWLTAHNTSATVLKPAQTRQQAELDSNTKLYYQLTTGHLANINQYLDHQGDPNLRIANPTKPTETASLLYFAAKAGQLSVVNRLLLANATLNQQFPYEISGALYSEHLKVIDRVIVDPQQPIDEQQNHIAHQLVKQHNLPLLKYMRTRGIELFPLNVQQQTPLHLAIQTGQLEIVKYLVELSTTGSNDTAIAIAPYVYFAAQQQELAVLEYLLPQLEDIEAKDLTTNQTVLMAAFSAGLYDNLALLLQKGADPKSVLQSGLINSSRQAVQSQQIACELLTQLLINYVADPNKKMTYMRDLLGTTHYIDSARGRIPAIHQQLQENNDMDPARLTQQSLLVQDQHGQTTLHIAAAIGQQTILMQAERLGIDIRQPVSKVAPSLAYIAVVNDKLNILSWLVEEKNFDVNIRDSQGRTLLMVAATQGSIHCFKWLLNHNAEIDVIDQHNRSTLFVTTHQGSLTLLRLLVDQQTQNKRPFITDIDHRNGAQGTSCLQLAALKGQAHIMKYLIKLGADSLQLDYSGNTCLHYAAEGQSLPAFRLAYNLNPQHIDQKNHVGESPIHIALKCKSHLIAEFLVNVMKADTFSQPQVKHFPHQSMAPRDQKSDGLSALQLAANFGKQDLMAAMIRKGGDFTVKDRLDRSPLDIAIQAKQTDTVEWLKQSKRFDDVDQQLQAIQQAVISGSPQLFNALRQLKDGNILSVNTLLSEKITPLYVAAAIGNELMTQHLLDEGAQVDLGGISVRSPLLASLIHQKPKTAELLIDHGADVSALDDQNQTALHHAVVLGSESLVIKLLMYGVDLNQISILGETALDRALIQGNSNIVDLCLSFGASYHLSDDKIHAAVHPIVAQHQLLMKMSDPEDTSLHRAVRANKVGMMHLLMQITPINVVNSQDETPLFLATNTKVVQVLLNGGADINHQNAAGKTVLDVALAQSDWSIINILQPNGAKLTDFKSLHGTHLLLHQYEQKNLSAFKYVLSLQLKQKQIDQQQFEDAFMQANIKDLICILGEGPDYLIEAIRIMGLDKLVKQDDVFDILMTWFDMDIAKIDQLEYGLYHACLQIKNMTLFQRLKHTSASLLRKNAEGLTAVSVVAGLLENIQDDPYYSDINNRVSTVIADSQHHQLMVNGYSQLFIAAKLDQQDIVAGLTKLGALYTLKEACTLLTLPHQPLNNWLSNLMADNVLQDKPREREFLLNIADTLYQNNDALGMQYFLSKIEIPLLLSKANKMTLLGAAIDKNELEKADFLLKAHYQVDSDSNDVSYKRSLFWLASNKYDLKYLQMISQHVSDISSDQADHLKTMMLEKVDKLNEQYIKTMMIILLNGLMSHIDSKFIKSWVANALSAHQSEKKAFLVLYLAELLIACLKIQENQLSYHPKDRLSAVTSLIDEKNESHCKILIDYLTYISRNRDIDCNVIKNNELRANLFFLCIQRQKIDFVKMMISSDWNVRSISTLSHDQQSALVCGLSSENDEIKDIFQNVVLSKNNRIEQITGLKVFDSIKNTRTLYKAAKTLSKHSQSELIPYLLDAYHKTKILDRNADQQSVNIKGNKIVKLFAKDSVLSNQTPLLIQQSNFRGMSQYG